MIDIIHRVGTKAPLPKFSRERRALPWVRIEKRPPTCSTAGANCWCSTSCSTRGGSKGCD